MSIVEQLTEQTADLRSHRRSTPAPGLRDLGLAPVCLSAELAAVFLGLAPRHARRIQFLGQQGRLPRVAVGKTFVYPIEGLRKYVQNSAAEP